MSAASMTFLLTSTLLKLCAATNKCGCSGVHDLDHLRTNGLRDVGERGHGVAIAQKTSIARGLVVENQRSVERTTARRRHPIFLLGLRIFIQHYPCILTISSNVLHTHITQFPLISPGRLILPFRVGQALTGATDPPAAHSAAMKMWVYFESVRTPKEQNTVKIL